MDQPLPDFPSHELLIVSSKYSKNWVRGVNMKSYVSPNIECTLNRGNYEAKTRLLHSTVQTSKCPHRFWERDPEIVRTCSMCPCRAFDTLIFFIFLAGYVCSLNTQISPTIKKIPHIWRNITKKCICHLLGRGKINVDTISGTISQNRRGYWTLKVFRVICVNQPAHVGACRCPLRFQCVMSQVNSVGCNIRRLHGNRKTRPKKIDRRGCLFASPFFGILFIQLRRLHGESDAVSDVWYSLCLQFSSFMLKFQILQQSRGSCWEGEQD